jgi:branched-chain amino acid transport system substrate-binding protein
MSWVPKECAHGRLFRRILLMSFLYGFVFAPHLQADPVKVAVLLPFSGVYRTLGVDAKNGFLLGLKKEATEAKVNLESWVTFDFLDDQADPDHGLELAKKVIGEGAKAILGIVSSAVALKLKDYVLNEAQVPFIVFAASGTSELRNTHPLFLRTTFSNQHAGIGLALWIKEHPVVPSTKPRWACIHADLAAGPDFCNGFALLYKQIGEEIGRVPVPFKTLEKKPQLVQLAKLQPDFAFAFFAGAEAAVFVQDYYRFKIHEKIPLLAPGDIVTGQLLQFYEKTLDQYGTAIGVLSALHWAVDLENQENHTFVGLYQDEYQTPPSHFAMSAYDAGRLLVKALTQLEGRWDGVQLVQQMKTLPLSSPRDGKVLKFDTHGDPINPEYIFRTERQGDHLVNTLIGQVPSINMDDYLK